jgi:cytochrome P450
MECPLTGDRSTDKPISITSDVSTPHRSHACAGAPLLALGGLRPKPVAQSDELLEQCANESIRMAQRSITLRQVLQRLELHDGDRTYSLDPGVMITTMLSVNNNGAAPGLEHFDPRHYQGRKLSSNVALEAKELVSTFGHGRHSCPAQRFSISAIRIAIRRLLESFDLEPRFESATPLPRQIGGVARAARPCPVAYRRRRQKI